ncbi:helix-turn-helix domain-containing protein [Actinoplanes sp. NPDC023936]|uniref:ATP-binding protein n=1 Tax=Actinoplanes sp. NPDC023936 TaxID=3154910 RepID=UPI00340F8B33
MPGRPRGAAAVTGFLPRRRRSHRDRASSAQPSGPRAPLEDHGARRGHGRKVTILNGDDFGSLLRRLRAAAELTLEQLAETAGLSDRAISDMERGISRGPRASTVAALADALRLGEPERAALAAAARAGRRSGPSLSHGALPLPRTITDFTGRDAERDWIRSRATAAKPGEPGPVLLLSGSPGIGKTSLAVTAAAELAEAFPDGRYFLDLQGLAEQPLSPTAVLVRLIQAVAPQIGRFSHRLADATTLWRSLCAGRRILVVLDNAAGEAQVRTALPAEGPAAVIVTSRRMLSGLEGVDRLRVASLPEHQAVRLLGVITADRAENPGDLRHLARLCANVPLAIRVAGNRLASRPRWSAGDLIERLTVQERRLDTLAAGDLQVSATFALSYEQLSPPARRLFRRLSLIFGSTAGEEVAAILTGDSPGDAADALDELIELGLLQESEGARVRFHDLLRLFAGQRLRQEESADQVDATRGRLQRWLLGTAVAAGSWYEPGGTAEAPEPRLVPLDSPDAAKTWLMDEAENWFGALASAAASGEHRQVVDVAESLHWFSDHWMHWGRWHEVFAFATEAARRLGDDRLVATQLGYLSWAHLICLGDSEGGVRYAREAFRFAERAADHQQMAWADTYLSWALLLQERHDEALPPARDAVENFRLAGDYAGEQSALVGLGDALRLVGRYDEALAAFDQAFALLNDPATAPIETIAQQARLSLGGHTALVHLERGDWPAVVEAATIALAPADVPTMMQGRIRALRCRARAYRELGDVPAARADFEALLLLQSATNDEAGIAETEQALRELPR